jgi:hypothetical protein
MNVSPHGDPQSWRYELARIHTHIDELQARVEAQYQIVRSSVDAEIAGLRAALRRLEIDVAAARPDAYAQRITELIADLRLKGDAAYELLRERLRDDD